MSELLSPAAAAPTLRTFEAVARNLSFTKAADELALTQSAVSHQIRALEDHLGARLFQRLHRGIDLTADGRRFPEGARRMGQHPDRQRTHSKPAPCRR